MGPFFSDAKPASPGTKVHRDLAHEVGSCGHGAEARGRPQNRVHGYQKITSFRIDSNL